MGNFDSALQRIAERQKSRDPWHIAGVLVGAIAGQVTKGFLIGIGLYLALRITGILR
jgi:hypothetical protein